MKGSGISSGESYISDKLLRSKKRGKKKKKKDSYYSKSVACRDQLRHFKGSRGSKEPPPPTLGTAVRPTVNECKSGGRPSADSSWEKISQRGPNCAFDLAAERWPKSPLPATRLHSPTSVTHPAPALRPDRLSLDILRPDVQLPPASSRPTVHDPVPSPACPIPRKLSFGTTGSQPTSVTDVRAPESRCAESGHQGACANHRCHLILGQKEAKGLVCPLLAKKFKGNTSLSLSMELSYTKQNWGLRFSGLS